MIPLLIVTAALTVLGVEQFTNIGTGIAVWLGIALALFRPIRKATHAGRQLLAATRENTDAVRTLTSSNADLGAQLEDLSNRVTALEHAQDRSKR